MRDIVLHDGARYHDCLPFVESEMFGELFLLHSLSRFRKPQPTLGTQLVFRAHSFGPDALTTVFFLCVFQADDMLLGKCKKKMPPRESWISQPGFRSVSTSVSGFWVPERRDEPQDSHLESAALRTTLVSLAAVIAEDDFRLGLA